MEEKANFENMRVYQQSLKLVSLIYKVTRGFPKEEAYGLTSQIRRAAVSVCLNIAEGQGRRSTLENKQFSQIAKGSLHEVLAVLEIAHQERYLSNQEKTQIRAEVFSLIRQIQNLINYLKT